MPSSAIDKFELIFQKHPLATWLVDCQSLRFLEVNEAAIQMYGYTREEFLAMRITDIRPPEDVPKLVETLAAHGHDPAYQGEWRHRLKDGTLIDVSVALHRFEVEGRQVSLVVGADITKRKALETQLRQSQKMEAIGRLAGGIAHDFNNFLGVVLGYAQLLELDLPPDARGREMIQEIVAATRRASALTQRMLTFSRKQRMELRPIEINESIAELSKMLERIIGEDIALRMELIPQPVTVEADAGMIAQVVMNLAVNARDAMPRGGTLRISTALRAVRPIEVEGRPGARPGEYVVLTVRDTGKGMSAETRSHLFEPFYTTKEVGKGTGLGLATVLGIIEQHRGWVDVESEPEKGSTFWVYLPVALGHANAQRANRPAARRVAGDESILLVEDDVKLRQVEAAVLERHGYRVLQADSGPAALELWTRHRDNIRLVVADMIMPGGMNGTDLVRLLRTERPELRAIVLSGYVGADSDQNRLEREDIRFLPKPVEADLLATTVRTTLDAGYQASASAVN